MTEPTSRPHDMSAEQRAREDEVVARVLASFDGCAEPRLRELMRGVVTHLHAFLRDVRLTEDEWGAAIAFLAAAGQITDDRRQEFVLLSDTLGASMQTITINNEAQGDATEATVFGPFFVDDLETTGARVLAAGATRLEHQPNADHCFVYADPAGHPFCLSTWEGPRVTD